jgi:hypothetical protein
MFKIMFLKFLCFLPLDPDPQCGSKNPLNPDPIRIHNPETKSNDVRSVSLPHS